ncbi:hypothetical protein ACLNGM_17000 [Aureimonas phyllosphaerae]|uniref:hypothetical protein n=1 Tax=Aureimonas phyllosphaerae TaxID=1166078 RepID=UPI003A5C62A7
MTGSADSKLVGPWWLPIAIGVAVVLAAEVFELTETEWLAVVALVLVTILGQNFESIKSFKWSKGELEVIKHEIDLKAKAIEADVQTVQQAKEETARLVTANAVLAAEVSAIPTGTLSGGHVAQHDRLLRAAVDGMKGAGLSDREIDKALAPAAPGIEKRVYIDLISKAGLNPQTTPGTELWVPDDIGIRPVVTPDRLADHLRASTLAPDIAERLVAQYRSWYAGPGKVGEFLQRAGT